ncbi:MAG TPA: ATP-binding cassette domain-containing protein [Steroidobacteraceae bacterium]
MPDRYIETTLRHVNLRRGGREVLRDIDWTIRPSERWILAGPNGAGKTQLLKLVAGSVWPEPREKTVRSYLWRGERHSSPSEVREEIGYIGPERQDRYERYGWNPTVEQVVGTGLYRTDIPLDPLTRDDRRSIAALLERVGLLALAERRFLALSYGERRLALLARALAARPKLLLLDELLNGLDAERRDDALLWLARTRRSALPWVLTSHRIEDLPPAATHALVLERGRIVYRGRIERAPLDNWLSATASGAGEHVISPLLRARTSPRAEVLVRLVRASVFLEGRRVLEGISLEIARGECWVIHGPNGSGKSTLLRTIYGDHGVAVGGRIERAGIAPGVSLDAFKRRVGFIAPHLQSSLAATTSLLARLRSSEPTQLTVLETVLSGLHASFGLSAPPSAAERRAARRALADFGLASLAARQLRELSYGQLRRVLFARAWINRPALLLLDEPFSGLDAATREDLKRELEALAVRGATIVIATHHRQEWPRCASCELELRAGRVRYRGPVRHRKPVRRREPAPRGEPAREAARRGVLAPRRGAPRRASANP